MQSEYQNVVFTKHAIHRLKKRRISQDAAVQAIRTPDEHFIEDDGDTRFVKTVNGRNVHVVGSYLKDEKRWMVITAWVRGEEDRPALVLRLLMLPLRLVAWGWRRLRNRA